MKRTDQLRIILICDNKQRELSYLQVLRSELIEKLHARVYILGSIAELQRMYYAVYSIQPHLVILSQVFEKSCRALAQYVRDSGGKVAIVPCELRVTKAFEYLVMNDAVNFSSHVDYYFMPGKKMLNAFLQTDLDAKKMSITGSPKMDVLVNKSQNAHPDRSGFMQSNKLQFDKQNIFIFTSFVQADVAFLKKDILYSNQLDFKQRFNTAVEKSRNHYLQACVELANSFSKYNVIIKPHPLEKTDYSKLLPLAEHKNLFVVDAPIEQCIPNIDVAVHWMSTTALECWIAGIPTIQYFPVMDYSDLLPDFAEGNLVVSTISDLQKAVRVYASKPNTTTFKKVQRQILSTNFFKLDGKASQRIATVLAEKLIKRNKLVYKPMHSSVYVLVHILEKLVGVQASRKLMAFLSPSFQSKYAIDNYLNIS